LNVFHYNVLSYFLNISFTKSPVFVAPDLNLSKVLSIVAFFEADTKALTIDKEFF